MSARRFRAALSGRLGRPVYAVPPKTWEASLAAAFEDGTVFAGRAGPEVGEAPAPSIEDRVLEFAAGARPEFPGDDEGEKDPWPVLRDGLVLFPLRVLLGWLARRIEGPAPALGEITRAVRNSAGGPYGVVRLCSRRVRVWSLPWRGGTPAGDARHAASAEV